MEPSTDLSYCKGNIIIMSLILPSQYEREGNIKYVILWIPLSCVTFANVQCDCFIREINCNLSANRLLLQCEFFMYLPVPMSV